MEEIFCLLGNVQFCYMDCVGVDRKDLAIDQKPNFRLQFGEERSVASEDADDTPPAILEVNLEAICVHLHDFLGAEFGSLMLDFGEKS